ncbi:DUF4389 domain-containing protein [Streptomyces sp. NPDC015184]|uniref:DUF4389 domain-containing protein n=1 Tax=Streptomyces sp. NPDC015184 TaxID=3364946 RepID=UPI00370152B6
MADAQWSPRPRPWTAEEQLPVLDVIEPPRQRRLTVLVRLLLLIPHFVVLFLLHIAAVVTVILGWFAALFLGRLPGPFFRFLAGYLGYQVRVGASSLLLVDRYPPFTLGPAPDYPARIEVVPTTLNRLAVLFRLILMIPAAIVQGLAASGWWAVGVVWWLITLILGRMPRPLFEATAAVLRYTMRFYAYFLMLTPAYPKSFFGDDDLSVSPRQARSATRPLVMSSAGKALLALFLVLGAVTSVTSSTTSTWTAEDGDGG